MYSPDDGIPCQVKHGMFPWKRTTQDGPTRVTVDDPRDDFGEEGKKKEEGGRKERKKGRREEEVKGEGEKEVMEGEGFMEGGLGIEVNLKKKIE